MGRLGEILMDYEDVLLAMNFWGAKDAHCGID